MSRSRAIDHVLDCLATFPGTPSSWLVGEPGDPPPDQLVKAMKRSLASPHHLYSPPAGLPGLREVIADSSDADVSPAGITVTHGAKSGLFVLLNGLLEPGDEVLIPLPCYPAYPELVRLNGGTPVPVKLGDRSFNIDTDILDDAAGPRTRAVLLSSPSNPTGATLRAEQARALVEWARERGVAVVSDEAYEAFRFAPGTVSSPAAFDPGNETVIQVKSFSKTYNLCGWRIGYLVANPALSRIVAQRQSALVNPPNTPAQIALMDLPSVPDVYLEAGRARVLQRLGRVGEVLRGCGLDPGRPDGGFYLWFDIRNLLRDGRWESGADWCADLATQHGAALWPGEDYMAPGWVRLSAVACSMSNLENEVCELERRLTGHLG